MTAVEWLVQHLTAIGELNIPDGYNAVTHIVQQAIEMEKQQIINAWKNGDGEYDKPANKLAELYYNETYKPFV